MAEEKTSQKEATEDKKKTRKKTADTKAENYKFQSEVQQLLNILIYSLYQHKEVFLRELISNAVDALNKVKFESLTSADIEDRELDFKIDIKIDKDGKKLIVEDTGIGMTKQELIDNIGTIARSGTMDFVKKVMESDSKDKMDLIGQFGVGFYSSFMVAEEIHLHTRSYQKGAGGYLWKSKGDEYSIEEKAKEHRGTRIELFVRDEQKEFLEKWRVKSIINQHSKFVPFPIYLDGEKIESVEAIWTQPKTSLKEKDYHEFYRFFQNANDDPEAHLHLSSDAPVQFNAIMYIPKTNTEIYGFIRQDPGIDLYSRKILIQKSCPDILPLYFRFIKGVVDSEDIPLNISRETIQSDMKISNIRKYVLKKVLDQLAEIKTKDMDRYQRIWKNFQKNFKEGVPNEYEHQEKLASLMLFYSSKTPKGQYTDLDQYVERTTEEQIEIYYVLGNDYDSIERNPALEAFKKKDLEVLYFTDPMEVWTIDHLRQYKGKIFRPVEATDIKLEDDEAEAAKKASRDAENFVSYLKKAYGKRVEDVAISKRLVDSPCVLVNSKTAPVQMERMMRGKEAKPDFTRKVLEINTKNRLIKNMIRLHKTNPRSKQLKTLSLLLLDNMILREGVTDDIENVIPRMQEIMLQAVGKE
jgi:HSP90 family molecular chaperone